MVALVTIPSSAAGVRLVRISVPLIAPLLDNQKYFLPGDLPPATGVDLRSMARPRIGGRATPPIKSGRRPGRPRSSRRFEDEIARDLERAAELLGDPA